MKFNIKSQRFNIVLLCQCGEDEKTVNSTFVPSTVLWGGASRCSPDQGDDPVFRDVFGVDAAFCACVSLSAAWSTEARCDPYL